jgi:uncharacterized membrane protein
MTTSYNAIAGQNVERLAALSDGIFGVAMTLLLLKLDVPDHKNIASEHDLLRALATNGPALLVYLMSFMTLGIFWVGQQSQLNHLSRSDRHLTWIHLAFLFAVTIVPFSTQLLTQYIAFRTALIVYWLNIVVLGWVLFVCWMRATRAGLVKPEVSPRTCDAIFKRIVYAQALYAVGAGLCIFSTAWSIAFIVAVQLNYAIAPSLGWRKI